MISLLIALLKSRRYAGFRYSKPRSSYWRGTLCNSHLQFSRLTKIGSQRRRARRRRRPRRRRRRRRGWIETKRTCPVDPKALHLRRWKHKSIWNRKTSQPGMKSRPPVSLRAQMGNSKKKTHRLPLLKDLPKLQNCDKSRRNVVFAPLDH